MPPPQSCLQAELSLSVKAITYSSVHVQVQGMQVCGKIAIPHLTFPSLVSCVG
jgi:hypothetical protein